MSDSEFSDETLMAYADGELDAATADAVDARLRTDPALAARIRMFEDTAQLARDALDPVAREPVPPRLLAAARRPAPPWNRLAGSRPLQALAACVVLTIGLGAGYLVGQQRSGGPAGGIAGLAACDSLQGALESAASGERRQDGGCIAIPVASYRDRHGAFCRAFQTVSGAGTAGSATAGIACREDGGGWRTRVAIDMTAGGSPDQAYRPAGGPEGTAGLEALGAAIGLAAPLAPAEEARLLREDWRAPR